MSWTVDGIGLGPSKYAGPQVVTYRHLLSKQSLTPQNPLRCIAHCDIDAAYAQFEMVRLGLAPETPVACQQWGGLIAINYPARAFGITRHMNVEEAKRKCPELVAVHVATFKEGEDQAGYWPDAKPETHKVSLEPFRRESLKILKVFSDSCPTIEKASIDEAYLDFTQPVRDLILDKNPHLQNVPQGSELGLDTPLPDPPEIDWQGRGNVIPVLTRLEKVKDDEEEGSEAIELRSEEEQAPLPPSSSQYIEKPSDPLNAWSDYALALGAELMQKCRTDVLQQLGYTCSAGVARNKILAKLCSAYRKPNAQTILRNEAIPGFLRPLKFTKIRSLGGKLGASIAVEYDAATVGDLWNVPLHDFQSKVGTDSGSWIYNVLRGVEYGEVAAKTDVKTMLSSKNFKPSLTKWDEVMYWLRIIATDLYARLNEARAITPGVWPKTIVLGVRDDKYNSRHRQSAFPMTNTLNIDHILKCGERLMKEYRSERKDSIGLITNLSLSFAGLERAEKGQQGIQGFFGGERTANAEASTSNAPSRRGSLAPPDSKGKEKQQVVDLTLEDEEEDSSELPSPPAVDEAAAAVAAGPALAGSDELESSDSDDDLAIIEPTGPVYRCALCSATISIQPQSSEEVDAAKKRVEAMHLQWHERQQTNATTTRKGKRKKEHVAGASKPKKKKKGQQKLKSFFKKG